MCCFLHHPVAPMRAGPPATSKTARRTCPGSRACVVKRTADDLVWYRLTINISPLFFATGRLLDRRNSR